MRLPILLASSAWTIITWGALGCGGSVEIPSGDTGGGGGDSTSSSTATLGGAGGSSSSGGTTTSSSAGGGVPAGFCADVCAISAEGSCLPAAECESYCDAHTPDWPASVGDAFAKCVADHPLCFETIEGCLLAEMYPPDSLHEVLFTATGLDAYEGKTLRIWHDPDAPGAFGGEGPIVSGQIAFQWTAAFQPSDSGGPLLLMYIDMDSDGACVPAADVTHSTFTEWNGDLLNPVFSVTVTPPWNDAPFVCDYQP